jgi:hypothetical protein
VLVPKAAMHKNNFAPPGKNDVWPARQIIPMQPIPVPKRVKKLPNSHLRPHACALNAPHVLAAIHWGFFVHS